MKALLSRLAVVAALVFAAPAAQAQTPDPAVATIQGFYDVLLAAMKGGKALGPQGRFAKLKPAVDAAFDIGTMVKYAVGESWSTTSPADQKALTDAFARMTTAQYAGNFSSFSGEKFIVDPAIQVRGTDHYVSSKLVTSDQTVVFIYRLRQFGGGWKIIDVLLDGNISQLSVYRADFAATIKAGGAPALIKKIDALSDKALK
ncbi:MAG: ABC transporter substrate-binding protein [Rhizomicrobium sp.]